jgi:hypothetical protein
MLEHVALGRRKELGVVLATVGIVATTSGAVLSRTAAG